MYLHTRSGQFNLHSILAPSHDPTNSVTKSRVTIIEIKL